MDCYRVQDLERWKAFGVVLILEVERIQKGLRAKKKSERDDLKCC